MLVIMSIAAGLQMELSLTPRMAVRLLEELLPRMRRGAWEAPRPFGRRELQSCLQRAAEEAEDQWLGSEESSRGDLGGISSRIP